MQDFGREASKALHNQALHSDAALLERNCRLTIMAEKYDAGRDEFLILLNK